MTILGLGTLHEQGYTGSGTTIAIIDAGFFRANEPSVFDQSHIIASYDLLPEQKRSGEMFTDPDDAHGTSCLSTMLYRDDSFCGTAPDADYILIRTEDRAREDTTEIDRLIQALEMADSLDVDVVSISLGYYQFDDPSHSYTYAQLDGTSRISQVAADVATRRIVCIAAGNLGNQPWHYIMIPADAYHVTTCGAVDSLGQGAAFSSWGPTADGRLKPEVSAWGAKTWIYRSWREGGQWTGGMQQGNGTSFATPELAGMFACLRQALPTLSPDDLRDAVYRSADRYASPDMHVGYGIPNATQAMQIATDIRTTREYEKKARKGLIWQQGQWIIERNGEKFTILGQKM